MQQIRCLENQQINVKNGRPTASKNIETYATGREGTFIN